MSANKSWQVLDLLNTTVQYFTDKEIENPRLNAEQLLGKVLNLKRVDLYVSFERPVSLRELQHFRELVKRRAQGEPLQYILGETEFMSLPFKVAPAVLIPRPETEILVEEVLKLKAVFPEQEVKILDIGTGSACIAVSLAHYWPQAKIFATDISGPAVELAKENARLNNVSEKIEFIQHDIFAPRPKELPGKVNIIVSNPPYISRREMAGLQNEVRDFEPKNALTDGADGLRFYRRIFTLCALQGEADDESILAKNGFMLVEMSGSQPGKIINLAQEFKFKNISYTKDLTDIPRVLKTEV